MRISTHSYAKAGARPWLAMLLACALTGAAAAESGSAALGGWLFEHYITQQIEIAAQRIGARDGAKAQDILKSRAVMARALERHRGAFEATIAPAIASNFGDRDIDGLLATLQAISADREAKLSDVQRQGLGAMDAEFRRNGQAVIRAVAVDLETLVVEVERSGAAQ